MIQGYLGIFRGPGSKWNFFVCRWRVSARKSQEQCWLVYHQLSRSFGVLTKLLWMSQVRKIKTCKIWELSAEFKTILNWVVCSLQASGMYIKINHEPLRMCCPRAQTCEKSVGTEEGWKKRWFHAGFQKPVPFLAFVSADGPRFGVAMEVLLCFACQFQIVWDRFSWESHSFAGFLATPWHASLCVCTWEATATSFDIDILQLRKWEPGRQQVLGLPPQFVHFIHSYRLTWYNLRTCGLWNYIEWIWMISTRSMISKNIREPRLSKNHDSGSGGIDWFKIIKTTYQWNGLCHFSSLITSGI